MGSRWNGHSACEVIRYLAARRTPEITLRQVLAGLGLSCSDQTLKIQSAAGRKAGSVEMQLTGRDALRLKALLATHGPSGGVVDEIPARKRERVRLEEPDPEPDWKHLPDPVWAEAYLARCRVTGQREALTGLQMDLRDAGHGEDNEPDSPMRYCYQIAVRRLRKQLDQQYTPRERLHLKE